MPGDHKPYNTLHCKSLAICADGFQQNTGQTFIFSYISSIGGNAEKEVKI